MQAYDFCSTHLNHDEVKGKLQRLKAHEFTYFRFENFQFYTEKAKALVEQALGLSQEVYICIDESEYSRHKDSVNKLFLKGLKGFCLRVKTKPQKFVTNHYSVGHQTSGDRDIIENYQKLKADLPQGKILAIEFKDEADARLLAPTIANLHLEGMPFAVLHVEGDPKPEEISKMRNLFEYLRMRRAHRLNVYFNFSNPARLAWQLKSMNTFSGISDVHIDISNRCTHSCVFCGLYGPTAIQEMHNKNEGKISPELKKFMQLEIDPVKCMDIIQGLPVDVNMIQFGGAGDPLMHNHAIEFISAARKRGFAVEVLSNMEYLEKADIELLTNLGANDDYSLHFIANVSGGTAEVYNRTRPKQKEKVFNKVVNNLKTFSKYRIANSFSGATITLMCVVNKLNLNGLPEVAQLAIDTGVQRVWFKPMELHHELMRSVLPSESERKILAEGLKKALKSLDQAEIFVMQREYCEKIIEQEI